MGLCIRLRKNKKTRSGGTYIICKIKKNELFLNYNYSQKEIHAKYRLVGTINFVCFLSLHVKSGCGIN